METGTMNSQNGSPRATISRATLVLATDLHGATVVASTRIDHFTTQYR